MQQPLCLVEHQALATGGTVSNDHQIAIEVADWIREDQHGGVHQQEAAALFGEHLRQCQKNEASSRNGERQTEGENEADDTTAGGKEMAFIEIRQQLDLK